MKKTTLLIMAAGIGSRFGGGIKQLEPVGLNDEIIMDYSIHDAIEAGFNKIVIVIRKAIEKDFRERIGERIEEICSRLQVEVCYAYQELSDMPEGYTVPEGRGKPWGTCHAVLAARDLIREPFVVINADDYYGKHAFCQLHDWLIEEHPDNTIAMAGFVLKNTLSEHGGVTRGVCEVNSQTGLVSRITETRNIMKTEHGVEAGGMELDPNASVSMNMWAFPGTEGEKPRFLKELEASFLYFLDNTLPGDPLRAEYLLPLLIGRLLQEKRYSVKVLETDDHWFGVTFHEDKLNVIENFRKLITDGVYSGELYSDLLN